MKKKLEVSVSEMMQMRKDGYSNADIARILDCSYQTVLNYIGKQGRHMPSAVPSLDSKPKEAETATVLEEKTPEINVVSLTLAVDGYLFELNGQSGGTNVAFTDGQWVRIDDMDKFINAYMTAKAYALKGAQ